eukprot:31183-Pelagococcus_subviridis.AAC.7
MQPRSSAVIASSVVSFLRIFARFAFRFSTSSFTAIAHAVDESGEGRTGGWTSAARFESSRNDAKAT